MDDTEKSRLLVSLRHAEITNRLIEYLRHRQIENDLRLRKALPDTFQKVQGRAIELEDLITFFSSENNKYKG